MSWSEWWDHNIQTLGIALGFSFAGSGMILWANDKIPVTTRRALLVIVAGQFATAIATAFVQGYLGWSAFVAPLVGGVCGIVGLPMLFAVSKSGDRVSDRASDLTDGVVDRLEKKV